MRINRSNFLLMPLSQNKQFNNFKLKIEELNSIKLRRKRAVQEDRKEPCDKIKCFGKK